MRVYQLNGSRGADGLSLVERPDPVAGRGQILVRMRAGSLNYRDLLVAHGRYVGAAPPNLVPLSDGAGEVVAVGPDVRRFKVGDRVCPTFFQTWISGEMTPADGATALGGAVDGVLAELVVCDETAAVAVPDHLSFEEAACLPCAGVTVWAALYGPKPLVAGQTVLTLGTGGVSSLAIQFAHAAGARVISTSSSDAKLEAARALGAAETINYRTHPEWQDEVLRLTDRRGVDHVVEIGGAGTATRSIAATAMGGQVHMIGVLTMGEVNPLALIQWKTLRGIYVGSRSHFEAMNRMIAVHGIRPSIDRTFPFADAPAAYRHLESAAHVGKVVIRIA
ncbi:zinc-dependent alcohol dehydrogenase family protein [Zavarzinia sp. CC-PAN008]|uniref:zinc-dependent alcohol dehydrogenase family protein n=1 Tax=Zavarzinia sp. CC-PAN008 TaxID=3243332 RepID=UPI003F74A35F